MAQISRRSIAAYAVDQINDGKSAAQVAKSVAAALVDSGKQKDAELFIADLFEMLEAKGMLANATITSAKPLSKDQVNKIESAIVRAAKVKAVIINEVIDESVIGGFRIETAAHSWDKTISHKLAMIKGGI